VREFFRTQGGGGPFDTDFIHADEAETAVIRLLMGEDSVDMSVVESAEPEGFLPDGHFDKAVDPYQRPMSWSEGSGTLRHRVSLDAGGRGRLSGIGRAAKGEALHRRDFEIPDPYQRSDSRSLPAGNRPAGGKSMSALCQRNGAVFERAAKSGLEDGVRDAKVGNVKFPLLYFKEGVRGRSRVSTGFRFHCLLILKLL